MIRLVPCHCWCCWLVVQIDVNGQNQEVRRAFLAGNTAFIFTNSSTSQVLARAGLETEQEPAAFC